MVTPKDNDLLSSLSFVPLSELKKSKGDKMEKVRTHFIKTLNKQKGYAQKQIDHPNREAAKDEKHIFYKVDDKYVVEPRYGRRKVIIKKDSAIVVRDLPAVITTIDMLVESVRNKLPLIENALAEAASSSATSETKSSPAPANTPPSGKTAKVTS